MTRPLRAGDRVRATGTVMSIGGPDRALIQFEGGISETALINTEDLALITPAEPPVGSVVVKGGVAWVRLSDGWCTYGLAGTFHWSKLADGDVIHTPGGDA
jgi:hypothetical protein